MAGDVGNWGPAGIKWWKDFCGPNSWPACVFFILTHFLHVGSIFSVFGLLVQKKPGKNNNSVVIRTFVIQLYIAYFIVNSSQ